MSKNVIQNIVIILGILIIIAFLTLIYGMYSKISNSSKNLNNSSLIFSANLTENEKIKNIEILDKNKLLILIDSNKVIKAAIYDINKNKIIKIINR
jgi:hypothetical protein